MNTKIKTTMQVTVTADNPFGVGDEKNIVKYRIAELLGAKQFPGKGCPIGLSAEVQSGVGVNTLCEALEFALDRIIIATNAAYECRMYK